MAVKDPNEVYEAQGIRGKMVIPASENPKHIQAMKDGKAPLEYLVDFVMAGDAYVHQGGAIKYGYRNWTIDKIKASTYIAAIRRHLNAWSAGEDLDSLDKGGSGWSHLYHIRAGCAIVLDAENAGTLIDDRDRAESISQELEEPEESDMQISNRLLREMTQEARELERRASYVVRYTTVNTGPSTRHIPIVRTECYGPFQTFDDATYFVRENTGQHAGVATIDTVSPI